MNPFNSSNPARLDRRVTLLAPEESRDAAGGVVRAWIDIATVWADWTPQTGREVQQAGQFLPLSTGTLRIRWRSGVAAGWRVVMAETTFELAAPPVEVGRRVYLDLVVRALSAEAPDALSVRFLHDYSTARLHDDSLRLMEAAA
ncbi:MAG: phage head closure protein [Sphingomonadales bacterium]|nr:phage head closure protein [Sphingomonadales bacterium]